MMHWGESIRFAGRALAADKVKAFLTMLGITIGATSIVLVVTIIASGREYITAQIEGIGSNLAYAELERSGEKTIPQDEITPADLAAVRAALPMVVAAAGSYDVNAEVVVRGMPHRTRLVGVTEDFQRIRNLRITSGRYFDLEDFSSRDKVCLVTDKFARTAFGSEAALGNTVQLGQFRCTVIGTFREGVPTFGQSEIQDQTVLVPFPLTRVMTGDNFFQVIYTQADDAGEVPRMTSELLRLLHQRHRPEANYYVQNLGSLLETAKKASIAMTGVLLAIAILMLTTAGTGIMNIMLVNVAER